MRRSSTLARLITILLALVFTPVALVLLSLGGQTVAQGFFEFGYRQDLSPLIGPLLVQALGVLLLVVVVLTGVWSSAGLIAVGAFTVVALAMSAFPVTLSWLYRVVPPPWIDAAVYGIPLVVLPVLGVMGIVLARVRRDPRARGAGLGALGIVLAPLLLAGGGFALAWSVANGSLLALQRFQFDPQPLAIAAALGSVLLIVAGVGVTRWSPFALLLPGVVLLVGSIALAAAPQAVFPILTSLPRGVNVVVPTLILYGGSATAGLLYLAFTAVLLRVRAQARLTPPGETDAVGAAPYPPQMYPPQMYPPQGQQPFPPAPPAA
ncbi:hypothetical protein [Microbacterium sp. NPDC089695]|uniref:hypothetical protein n=1 Tax=Microbacterium sp. NPDC089695 TaxID=3364198 RepID=UPI0037F753DD